MSVLNFANDALSVATLVLLFLELIKQGTKLVAKLFNKEFTLPPLFFILATPILAALMPFVMVWMGMEISDPVLLMPFSNIIQYLVRILAATLIEYFGFYGAVSPTKDALRLAKQAKG